MKKIMTGVIMAAALILGGCGDRVEGVGSG